MPSEVELPVNGRNISYLASLEVATDAVFNLDKTWVAC